MFVKDKGGITISNTDALQGDLDKLQKAIKSFL